MIRVKLVTAGRLAALAVFFSIAGMLAVFLILRSKPSDTTPPGEKLQGRVLASFRNTRYAHEVEGRVRFVLTADTDRTYEDGTHELEQVKLESRGAAGDRNDVISADRARVSDPADLNRLDAEFISNVILQTSDGLTVKTSYLHYDHSKGVVTTKELVNFERADLSGHTTGLRIDTADERVQLLNDVDLTIKPQSDSRANPSASGRDPSAQPGTKSGRTPEEKAARKARKRARRIEARARRESKARTGENPGQKGAAATVASKKLARRPTRIQSQSALLENKDRRVSFNGSVLVTQGGDQMASNQMVGFIGSEKKIERIEARGSARLKQAEKLEITSADMEFFFGETQQLVRALATGNVHARSLGTGPLRESHAATVEALFIEGEEGASIDSLIARGNAILRVHPSQPVDPKTNPTTRELTAGVVTMSFLPDGQSLKSADATDNAVMTIVPIRAEAKADKKTMRAPLMHALFFEEGSRLKSFEASGGVRVDVEPMVKDERPPRTTTSRRLTADFSPDSQDVDRLIQEGDFKFNEADRNAKAERAVYEGKSEILNLRGGRPLAWDAKGSTEADEIDYDRQKEESHARGDVRTTYYSRETVNDSTPFKKSNAPIFVTSERAEASNKRRVAVFIGNARGWQENNHIKADRIELYEEEKRMVGIGNVDSALYSVKKKPEGEANAKDELVPGFASSDRMTYSDTERRVHYTGGVKAKQGPDRIEAESIEVFLMKETNEVERLTAERNVVITQPGRRGSGDKLVYTSDDGKGVLEGRAARVEDDEKGITIGSQLTFYSRDDKVFVDNRQGTGRVRSVHQLKKSKGK
jgi:lipopolysaccharide transport protein LptA/LPS export ABC transporter protein LptC